MDCFRATWDLSGATKGLWPLLFCVAKQCPVLSSNFDVSCYSPWPLLNSQINITLWMCTNNCLVFFLFLQKPSLNVTWNSGTKILCSAARSSMMPWWTVAGNPWTLLTHPSPSSLDNSCIFCSLSKTFNISLCMILCPPQICHDLTPHWHLQSASFSSLSHCLCNWRPRVHMMCPKSTQILI